MTENHSIENEIQIHPVSIQLVLAPHDEVDAGRDLPIRVRISCPEKCDLGRGKIGIVDGEGAILCDVELLAFDGYVNETDEFMVKAPLVPGTYTWTAVYFPDTSEEFHGEVSAEFAFTVKPHLIGATTWGVPLPVIRGSTFSVRIGAQCTGGCSLAHLPFVIVDDKGTQMASGMLGDVPLAQTNGLYWSELDLEAPYDEGLYTWTVEYQASGLELPHQVSSRKFPLKVSKPSEHIVTVEVVDKDRRTPIKNASVFLHPYRVRTDERGFAEVEATEASHELYVLDKNYLHFQTNIEVTGDVSVTAELIYCPDPTE